MTPFHELVEAARSACLNVHIVKGNADVPPSLRERIGELRRALELIDDTNCEACDGYGGYESTGSSAPAQICPRCKGSGMKTSA